MWTAGGGSAAGQTVAEKSEFEGRTVVSITFVPARQPLENDVLRSLLPLRQGEPFRTADAREAIQKLYATGRFEDIVVDAEPQNAGVSLRITTRNSWFIGRVEIQGDSPDPPNAGQLVTASRLELGQPFDKASVATAA